MASLKLPLLRGLCRLLRKFQGNKIDQKDFTSQCSRECPRKFASRCSDGLRTPNKLQQLTQIFPGNDMCKSSSSTPKQQGLSHLQIANWEINHRLGSLLCWQAISMSGSSSVKLGQFQPIPTRSSSFLPSSPLSCPLFRRIVLALTTLYKYTKS